MTWDGGWKANRRRQVEAWRATTPAQRLAWLEEAIRFAHRAGALPRRGIRQLDEPDLAQIADEADFDGQ